MGLVSVLKPRAVQPLRPLALDYANPLTRAIRCVITPAYGPSPRDPQSFLQFSPSSGVAPKPAPLTRVVGWQIGSVSDTVTAAAVLTTGYPVSMAVVFVPTTITGTAGHNILNYALATSANNRSRYGLRMGASGGVAAYSMSTAAVVAEAETTNLIELDKANVCVATFASGSSRTAYLNGGDGVTNTTPAVPSVPTATSMGSAPASGAAQDGHVGYYALGVIWERELRAGDAKEFMRNPWQIFRDSPLQIIVPPRLLVPVLSAAVATNITSTTATPGVTVTY